VNKGYRFGLSRIGCSICPFGSSWSEFILNKAYPERVGEYFKIITEHVRNLGITEDKEVQKYIIQGNWKKRGGGEGIERGNVRIDFIESANSLKVIMKNPRENLFEWLKVLGPSSIKPIGESNKYIGEIFTDSSNINFICEFLDQNGVCQVFCVNFLGVSYYRYPPTLSSK